jgi:hypothetical protein
MNRTRDSGRIRVADITIAQLSRGLYRSTATAFKELVNNAYDADATAVRINTNFPEFNFFSCVDNGSGMSLEGFRRYFSEEGIGSCVKRKGNRDITDNYSRPIIGRLGIGMLAVGQLCNSFEIESHYVDDDGTGKAYHANIILLEDTISDIEDVIRDTKLAEKEVEVGQWEYEEIPYDETKKGFSIYSWDVRDTFRNEMKTGLDERRERVSFDLSDLHSEFYSKIDKSIRESQPYLEAIWELSLLCPIAYYGNTEEYPIKMSSVNQLDSGGEREAEELRKAIEMIRTRQSKFLSENFRVFFDGIELRRYIQFPTRTDVVPRVYFIDFDGNIAGIRLAFSGYLFAQTKAIRPLELNGVQIRLRGVGIGGYDSTFLRYYEEIETIRSRWVSGEIFIDSGLEVALNIDRDSFNEHDEHFKKLQSELHSKIGIVFNKMKALASEETAQSRLDKERQLVRRLEHIVAERTHAKFRLTERDLGKGAPVVEVNEDKGEVILNTAAKPLRKKKANTIIRHVSSAYYIAKTMAESEDEEWDIFYNLIKEILGELV